MTLNQEKTVPEKYEVYTTEAGQDLIVLEGLDPNQTIEKSPLQELIHSNLGLVTTIYWLVFFTVLIFLVTKFILKPLLKIQVN